MTRNKGNVGNASDNVSGATSWSMACSGIPTAMFALVVNELLGWTPSGNYPATRRAITGFLLGVFWGLTTWAILERQFRKPAKTDNSPQ